MRPMLAFPGGHMSHISFTGTGGLVGSYQSASARGLFYLKAGSSSAASGSRPGVTPRPRPPPRRTTSASCSSGTAACSWSRSTAGSCAVRWSVPTARAGPIQLCPLTPLTKGARRARDADPTWSWDGKWIAFRRTFESGTRALMRLDVANPRDVRVLGKGPAPLENAPVWPRPLRHGSRPGSRGLP